MNLLSWRNYLSTKCPAFVWFQFWFGNRYLQWVHQLFRGPLLLQWVLHHVLWSSAPTVSPPPTSCSMALCFSTSYSSASCSVAFCFSTFYSSTSCSVALCSYSESSPASYSVALCFSTSIPPPAAQWPLLLHFLLLRQLLSGPLLFHRLQWVLHLLQRVLFCQLLSGPLLLQVRCLLHLVLFQLLHGPLLLHLLQWVLLCLLLSGPLLLQIRCLLLLQIGCGLCFRSDTFSSTSYSVSDICSVCHF